MAGAEVVQSGTWLLEVSLETSFILDNAVSGKLDNTTYTLAGNTTYVDVTSSVQEVTIRRGRRDVGDQFSSGTLSWTMLDLDGYYNPLNTASPYIGSNGQPLLAPLRNVRLSRYNGTTYDYVFIGNIVNYNYDFGKPGDLNEVQVYCADDFYLLSH